MIVRRCRGRHKADMSETPWAHICKDSMKKEALVFFQSYKFIPRYPGYPTAGHDTPPFEFGVTSTLHHSTPTTASQLEDTKLLFFIHYLLTY